MAGLLLDAAAGTLDFEHLLLLTALHRKTADAGSQFSQGSPKVVLSGDRRATDLRDHIACLQSRLQGGSGVETDHQAARYRRTAQNCCSRGNLAADERHVQPELLDLEGDCEKAAER